MLISLCFLGGPPLEGGRVPFIRFYPDSSFNTKIFALGTHRIFWTIEYKMHYKEMTKQ